MLFRTNRVSLFQRAAASFSCNSTSKQQHVENFKILVLGGYGSFGKKITSELFKYQPDDDDHSSSSIGGGRGKDIIIAGRNLQSANQFREQLELQQQQSKSSTIAHQNTTNRVQSIVVDVNNRESLQDCLKKTQPHLVIHTCGPFQGQNFHVAEQCIERGINYVDLSDSREFVAHFSEQLHEKAVKNDVLAICGASTVPGLSSAVLNEVLKNDLKEITSIDSCLSPGNRAHIGESTMRSILSYCGKPIPMFLNGKLENVIGWQGLKRAEFPDGIGTRYVAYCETPEVEVFPKIYPSLKNLEFRAGVELNIFQFSVVAMSYMARARLIKDWSIYSPLFKSMSSWFYRFGSDRGGMQMIIKGLDNGGIEKVITWNLIAKAGDGPMIPAVPSICIAKKLARGELINLKGAIPCVGLFSLDEFMNEVKNCNIYHKFDK